jgi:hypothetical protein
VLIAKDGSGVGVTVRGWLFDGFNLKEAGSRRGDLHEIRRFPARLATLRNALMLTCVGKSQSQDVVVQTETQGAAATAATSSAIHRSASPAPHAIREARLRGT